MEVGAAIRRHREARGWSRAHLARLTGVTPMTVTNWERRGRRPRRASGERLEALFGMETGALNE